MKQANVFYKSHLAGVLTENDSGYEFLTEDLKEKYNELLAARMDRLVQRP